MNLFQIIKNQLQYGTMSKDELQEKINVFFLVNQLTKAEYQELTNIIAEYKSDKEKEVTIKENIQEHNEEVTTQ